MAVLSSKIILLQALYQIKYIMQFPLKLFQIILKLDKQKADVAKTSSGIIISDKPTTSLDFENARLINEKIVSLGVVTRIVVSHDRKENHLDKFDEVILIGN